MSPRPKRGKSYKYVSGGGGLEFPIYTPPRRVVIVKGIQRRPHRRRRPLPPLTERHERVLGFLTSQPTGAAALAKMVDLSASATTSALYVLQSRGLATRLADQTGWIAVQSNTNFGRDAATVEQIAP